jgi:hypothetical protein
MKDDVSGESAAITVRPPEKISILFCPACGRDDLVNKLRTLHYRSGRLCRGKPVVVAYKRESV